MELSLRDFALDGIVQDGIEFEGTKRRTKEELQKMMYTDKMDEWLEEVEREENQRAMDFQNSVLTNDDILDGSQDDRLQVLQTSSQDDDEVVTTRRQLMDQPRISSPNIIT